MTQQYRSHNIYFDDYDEKLKYRIEGNWIFNPFLILLYLSSLLSNIYPNNLSQNAYF